MKVKNYYMERATLAEKEVTTLKEQLATTSPTPLQATVPPKTNGSHIDTPRDQETRIDSFSPVIKEEKRRTPDIDEDIEQKIEMAATARSNSNSSRSSPVVNQGNNLESELAAKEKEIADIRTHVFGFKSVALSTSYINSFHVLRSIIAVARVESRSKSRSKSN
ncbi:unnamed protein product [Colias eurytheme]|nr:unnamed protein product [Colias eurytheme]